MQRVAARNGMTSVQDMACAAVDTDGVLRLKAIQSLKREGKLTVRFAEALSLNYAQQLRELGIERNFGITYYHIGSLKSFADGGLGASTAWFTEPYTDNPANFGIASDQLHEPEKMYAAMQTADRANHEILNMYERLLKEDGPGDHRFRIKHVQTLLASDIDRFAAPHVIASVQPYHTIDDGRWVERRIGPGGIKITYAFRSLFDLGAWSALAPTGQ